MQAEAATTAGSDDRSRSVRDWTRLRGWQTAPVAFPLVARWTTWLLGIGILFFGGGSERSRELWPLLVALSLAGLLALSSLAWQVFGTGWPRRGGQLIILAAGDLVLSLLLIGLEGGWGAAFYEYGMTSVMLPSLVFGLAGVVVSSAAFSLGYLGILLAMPLPGRSLDLQIAALLNPWIVGATVAVIGMLLRRLEEATARNLELVAREERWRIAREIHDGVAQQSYVLMLGLETSGELARRGDLEGLRQRLPPLEKLSRQALLEVRQYVSEGRPLLLGERSLGEALDGLAREFTTVTGVQVEMEAPDDVPSLGAAQQSAIYRLVQESLANVFKHAEAQSARVTLRVEGERLWLEVADDGRGFDPTQAATGFGLPGMHRRVQELGGRCSIESRPGGGTRVQALIPLERPR